MGVFLKSVSIPPGASRTKDFFWDLDAFRDLADMRRLRFKHPVTIITGDNGVGKSTLLEAIALKLGFGAIGGRIDDPERVRSTGTESQLAWMIDLELSETVLRGYYLRAETHLDLVKYNQKPIESANRSRLDMGLKMSQRSHGESIFDIVGEYVDGPGLYLFDEPEAGLSVVRQMALLAELHQEAGRGAQMIIVTHSPIIMAIPGADILEIGEYGIRRRELEQTEAFLATEEFIADPLATVRFLTEGE